MTLSSRRCMAVAFSLDSGGWGVVCAVLGGGNKKMWWPMTENEPFKRTNLRRGGSISDPKAMSLLRVGGLSRNGVRMEIL